MKRLQSGFSLLEVLVAFVLMALSLGTLYQAAGGSTRAVVATEETTRAVILAESLLSLHPSVPPSGIQAAGETADGLNWQLQAKRHVAEAEDPSAWPLYELRATVQWGGEPPGRTLSLVTLVPERKY